MHWKTRNKLSKATKLYTLEPEEDKTHEIRIQLSPSEYVCIYLNEPFPKKVEYRSLKHGGFNYDPTKDIPITRYSKNQVVRILENSINFRNNDSLTINKLIALIDTMDEYI